MNDTSAPKTNYPQGHAVAPNLPVGDIVIKLSSLESLINVINDKSNLLTDRLTSVVQQREEVGLVEGSNNIEEISCGLSSRLIAIYRDLSIVNRRLTYLLDNLQL